MARPRIPQAKVEASGAAIKHAGRFADRKSPKRSRPIGSPYSSMTDEQKAVWIELAAEMPWLDSSDRVVFELACRLTARMRTDPDFGVNATQALSSLLSKLGATPADKSKVNHADGDDEEPEDKFFGRPN